ncbi:MAG: T9SS type A sorting domain-containing protein [Bacteroidales bacterium]|nr:T9SS type A sorting domain-containing protein [Candidatus Latescibacterota bacterium]
MKNASHYSGVVILVLFALLFFPARPVSAPGLANDVTMSKEATLELTIYGYSPELITVSGTETITYSDPYTAPDNHVWIDVEIVELELSDMAMVIRNNPEAVSLGSSRSLSEWIDFPAESFFDVMYEMEIPGIFPGETLITYEPMHLISTIDQWPPYGHAYAMVNPYIKIYNQVGLEVGEITMWTEANQLLAEPRANITVHTGYGSDVAEEYSDDVIEVRASINVPEEEIISAQFLWREEGTGGFIPFWTDFDGVGRNYGTSSIKESGDAWAGYLDISSFSTAGGFYDVVVDFDVAGIGHFWDTVYVYIDPTTPKPTFNVWPADSIRFFPGDSTYTLSFSLEDELMSPGLGTLRVYPLAPDFSRTLVTIDQHNLGTDYDDWACIPTATASCLKYFAENGHGNLDNPEGDEAQEELSPSEMAEELVGDMGTDSTGTTPDQAVSGIEDYLDDHGENSDDWEVEHVEVEDYGDIGEMLREFEADSEDVIILLADTNSAGDTLGHAGTLGSKNSECYGESQGDSVVGHVGYTLDFMDPNGGGSTEDNEYGVDENAEGRPILDGYSFTDSTGSSAWIEGYIKVSPPAGGDGSSSRTGPAGRRFFKAPSSAGWIEVSTGTVAGSGVVDSLQWNTTGYLGGLYLIEIVTIDDEGIQCRDLRLGGIPEYIVGDDPVIPGAGTMLRGSYPNPFNPSTTIEFYIAERTSVSITIFDISGRRVRRLIKAEEYDTGLFKEQWDGRNDKGSQLASGVYFCRFEAGNNIFARKLILLR